jgi:hypothetical protein
MITVAIGIKNLFIFVSSLDEFIYYFAKFSSRSSIYWMNWAVKTAVYYSWSHPLSIVTSHDEMCDWIARDRKNVALGTIDGFIRIYTEPRCQGFTLSAIELMSWYSTKESLIIIACKKVPLCCEPINGSMPYNDSPSSGHYHSCLVQRRPDHRTLIMPGV